MPKRTLQVAIDEPDLTGLDDTLSLLLEEGVDLIEAGTPLLTTHGLTVIERFSNLIPPERLYADLKCMDLAREQVTPYLDKGVRHISIHVGMELAQAERLLDIARSYRADLYVSTLGFPDQLLHSKLTALRDVGYLHCIFHGEGIQPDAALTRALARYTAAGRVQGIRPIVAGGINVETRTRIPLAGVTGVIVGRGVTRVSEKRRTIRELQTWLSS